MKLLSGLLLILGMLTSCSESFEDVDPRDFNETIATRTDIKSPEELIKIYYDYPPNEGTPKLAVNAVTLSEHKYEITLIHSGLEDDSQSGTKVVMVAELKGSTWRVETIKKNWKCWEGRGHTDWGTAYCN